MIEMLGVLAIIGVLSAGGIMGYTAAMENHKVNKTLEMMRYGASNMQNLFLGKSQYKGTNYPVTADDLCKLNILPSEICKTGTGRYRTGYFGETIRPQYWISSTNPYFEVYMMQLPVSICVRLVTNSFWNAYPKAFAVWLGNAQKYNTLPMTMSAAKTACEEQAAKAETAEFTFNINRGQ